MNVLVIGATGGTGIHLVKKLLARGDVVTAFARDPSGVKESHERLRVVKGDARDRGSLDAALTHGGTSGNERQDAVVVAFGPRSLGKDDLQETLAKNLVPAMKAAGVKRLVNLSAWGAGDSKPEMKLVFKVMRNTFLKNVFDDKERGETILLDPELDWVNVRPGRLLDEPARGGGRAALVGKGLHARLTREDLAAFMVEQVASNEWVRRSPLLGY